MDMARSITRQRRDTELARWVPRLCTSAARRSRDRHQNGDLTEPIRASSRRGLAKDVADAAHGVDEARLPVGLGLATQVADVDLEGVAGSREVEAPHLFEDAAPGEHPAWVGDQHLEKGELGAG